MILLKSSSHCYCSLIKGIAARHHQFCSKNFLPRSTCALAAPRRTIPNYYNISKVGRLPKSILCIMHMHTSAPAYYDYEHLFFHRTPAIAGQYLRCVCSQLALSCPSALSSLTLRFATHHTQPPSMRALQGQFVKSLTTCLDKNFVRSPKLGPDMCVHSEKRNGNMSCHCLCQKYFSKTFRGPKLGPDMCMRSEICNGTPVWLVHVKIHIMERE